MGLFKLKNINKKHFVLLLFITILSINAFSILNSMNHNKKNESITVDNKLLISSSNPVDLIWNRTWTNVCSAKGTSIGLDSLNNSYITG